MSRDTMIVIGNELRKTNSASYIVDSLLAKALKIGKNSVIESIRTVGEVESLQKLSNDFILIALDADPRVRYGRIHKRGSATDAVSFEKFLVDEKRESVSENPSEQNLPKCIALADYIFSNNSSPDDLFRQVNKVLQKFSI